MNIDRTSRELEQLLGLRLRRLRLLKNIDQKSLAERAGTSLNSVKHLESGKGARVNSLMKVLLALERVDWLDSLAPAAAISPMSTAEKGRQEPRRARCVRRGNKT